MEARPYQIRAVSEIREAVRANRSAVYRLPTGGGKTHVAGYIARKTAEAQEQTLFLVHRRELVAQAIEPVENTAPPRGPSKKTMSARTPGFSSPLMAGCR